MLLGIIGSRRRDSQNDFELTEQKYLVLSNDYKITGIVSGGCPTGGDRFAELIAKKYNVWLILYPAAWDIYGKRAGFIRNTEIAKVSNLLLACVMPDRTGGTEDTIKKYLALGKDRLFLV